MSLCILAGGAKTVIAATAFTLSWTHSVEKIRWAESWRVSPAGLELVEARVQGSGAGMEPPEGSLFRDGWWVYAPKLDPVPALNLAASGATASGWRLCAGGECRTFGKTAGDVVRLSPCTGKRPSD